MPVLLMLAIMMEVCLGLFDLEWYFKSVTGFDESLCFSRHLLRF